MVYTLGNVAKTQTVLYPINDACSDLVLTHQSTSFFKVAPLLAGKDNLIVQSTISTDVGVHNVFVRLCRKSNLNLCKEFVFPVEILPKQCSEVPTGLVVPDLTINLSGISTLSKALITTPTEVNAGSCGFFIYEILPSPELFTIVGENIEALPGLITPNWLGTNQFTLRAFYSDFPTIATEVNF